tara:strand:- start:3195 stop:4988 length:1794 start_codon:yes stop_codon:yes gene_type:complete
MRATKVRFKSSYSVVELSEIADTFKLCGSAITSLAAYEQMEGLLAENRFLRTSSIPVCTQCLEQAGYIRQQWHHQLVTACPEHKVMLLAVCPECNEHITLKRPSVTHCRCGFNLVDAPATVATVADLFVSRMLVRGGETCEGLGFRPKNIDAFLLFLANLTLPVAQRKNAPITCSRALEINMASYEFAVDLLPRFAAWVKGRVLDANRQSNGRFMAHLGGWYKELNTDFSGEAYGSVREETYRTILEHAVAPINRKMKQIGAELLGLKSSLTAAEAARTLRSSPDRIVALVKSGQLPGVILNGAVNEFCLVKRSDVEAHQQAAADFVHGKDLLKVLGVTRRARDRLIEVGVLHAVAEGQRPLFSRGDYRKSEAMALLALLGDGCPETDQAQGIALEEISAKRFSHGQANHLWCRIFAREIKPLCRVKGLPGLSAFRFDESDVIGASRESPRLIELTITELAKVAGWKHETIKGWIEAGYLHARIESGKKSQWLISLVDLICFLSTHVVAADAAVRLGSKSVWLMKPLMTAGVLAEGAHQTSAGTQRGVLFSTDALVNVASKRASTWSRPSSIALSGPSTVSALTTVVDRFCGTASST